MAVLLHGFSPGPSTAFAKPAGSSTDGDRPAAIVGGRAYAPLMGRTILAILGILLAIWLFFTVLGMLFAALKMLIWLGLLAVLGAVVVTVLSKLSRR